MEALQLQAESPGRIICCECGASIEPNAANMCVACIRSKVDITEGIPKQCEQIHLFKYCTLMNRNTPFIPVYINSSVTLHFRFSCLTEIMFTQAGQWEDLIHFMSLLFVFPLSLLSFVIIHFNNTGRLFIPPPPIIIHTDRATIYIIFEIPLLDILPRRF